MGTLASTYFGELSRWAKFGEVDFSDPNGPFLWFTQKLGKISKISKKIFLLGLLVNVVKRRENAKNRVSEDFGECVTNATPPQALPASTGTGRGRDSG